MIYAKNKDAASYRGIHPNLDLALEHITEAYLSSVGYDRVELRGSDVYATRFTYETVPPEESFFEAHKKYLDIHIMTEGSEGVEIAPPEGQKAVTGGFWRVNLGDKAVSDCAVPLGRALQDAINRLPKSWDCCSRYMECSNAKRCVHPDPSLALECGYRKILASGKIYYGENRNVD